MSRASVKFSKSSSIAYSSDESPEARELSGYAWMRANRCVVEERAGAFLPSSPIPPRRLRGAKPAALMHHWLSPCIHTDGYGR